MFLIENEINILPKRKLVSYSEFLFLFLESKQDIHLSIDNFYISIIDDYERGVDAILVLIKEDDAKRNEYIAEYSYKDRKTFLEEFRFKGKSLKELWGAINGFSL